MITIIHHLHHLIILPHTPFFDPSTGIESKVSLAKEQKQLEMEAKWLNQTPGMMANTSPWVCNVKEYNFTILTLFTFGLEGADELFENDHGHHGPGESVFE